MPASAVTFKYVNINIITVGSCTGYKLSNCYLELVVHIRPT